MFTMKYAHDFIMIWFVVAFIIKKFTDWYESYTHICGSHFPWTKEIMSLHNAHEETLKEMG